ncbi:RNA polymerase sigma factor [Runella salmonicolor]|uniref:Sigma-70 family RNA polymerase sigma factor n=1 Tax=Runella salmonicolor TaxID=2950278 RepID=A0ABT1FSD4_9BACT|nr:sigma-70 family RNA polymerase sigma factor [Runella salmonicolor]MCP1384622.1 sigma-70 family RNA polymerase sigma factor [Runella salmonicolor]
MKRSPQNNTDETTLWIAFKKGDVRAFEQLYNRYFEVLANYGYRYCNDKQQLEDAIQDVFVDLWRRRQHLADVESVKFYLFRALRHQVIRNTRNDLLETSEDINDFLDFLVAFSSEQQSIEQETHITQTQAVAKAIAQLSQRQQEAINLRFYHGMSLDEMTQLMSLSKQSVSNLLFKAYSVLRLTIKGIHPILLLLLQISHLIN